MKDINRVTVIGNLVREAEAKSVSTGMTILRFSLACNTTKKNGDKYEDYANYFDVKLFGKRADALKPYLVKGQKVCVDGELVQERWETDGKAQSKVVISANDIELLGAKVQNGSNAPKTEAVTPQDFADAFESSDIPF